MTCTQCSAPIPPNSGFCGACGWRVASAPPAGQQHGYAPPQVYAPPQPQAYSQQQGYPQPQAYPQQQGYSQPQAYPQQAPPQQHGHAPTQGSSSVEKTYRTR